jgi:lysophospholipase L1-like esterase
MNTAAQTPAPSGMSRRRMLSLAVLGAVGAYSSPSGDAMVAAVAAADVDTTGISMVGDSLTVGTMAYQSDDFIAAGWSTAAIDAHGSRGVTTRVSGDPHTGLTAVDALRAQYGDTKTWIVALGTNDARTQDSSRNRELIVSMLDRIGPQHKVIWVNIYLPTSPARQRAWNTALDAVAIERPDVLMVFDWASVAAAEPRWLSGDIVHYTSTGYQRRAEAIAAASASMARTGVPAQPAAYTPIRPEPSGPPGRFEPTHSVRVLDTRNTTRAVAAGQVRAIDVSSIVPAEAVAVAVNVTAVKPADSGYATLWPADRAQPGTSNVNFEAGRIVATHAVVPISASGRLLVFSSAATELVVDVQGWFSPTAPCSMRQERPMRLLDTRLDDRTNDRSSIVVPVPTRNGRVPAAAVVNVIATSTAGDGYVSVCPADQARSTTSMLNFENGGGDVSNVAHVALDDDGAFRVVTTGPADLVVDLLAAYDDDPDGLVYQAVNGCRLLDTRSGEGGWLGAVATDQSITLDTRWCGPIVVGTLVATTAERPGYVTTWSGRGEAPTVSTLNLATDRTVSAFAIADVSDNAQCTVAQTAGGGSAVLFDLAGWFTPAVGAGAAAGYRS